MKPNFEELLNSRKRVKENLKNVNALLQVFPDDVALKHIKVFLECRSQVLKLELNSTNYGDLFNLLYS